MAHINRASSSPSSRLRYHPPGVLLGGQTAIFHAVTQFDDDSLPVTQLRVERGADLTVRVKLPGDYERPGEIVECTALGHALLFSGVSERRTVTLLRERGAVD